MEKLTPLAEILHCQLPPAVMAVTNLTSDEVFSFFDLFSVWPFLGLMKF